MISQRQLFLDHVAQTSVAPVMLEIDHADGCWLSDTTGKKYLDLISGIAVGNIGYNNAVVKNAVKEQVDRYMHVMVYGEFIQSPQVKYAKWITDHLPGNLSSVYFTNSGAEAVDGAIKLAKRYTGRAEIISFQNSYHGSTIGALSAGNNEERKNPFRPLVPANRILRFNDFNDIRFITDETAAVIIEPVQAEAGIILPGDNYLSAIRERCTNTNTLLIFDECQTGFGRSGKLFAFQKENVVPDILILGKALGGGMPLGAFVSPKKIMDVFTSGPILGHITTFGGHPVCCAAGLAAAMELESQKLIADVEKKANQFVGVLKHPVIRSVRSYGLLIAIEFDTADINLSVCSNLIGKGILADWFLFAPNCLRIAPPLIITENEIELACSAILESITGF